jgi:NAD(P)-dependent dehydrogenase (short-subunit alcohol dehydrogenase family)
MNHPAIAPGGAAVIIGGASGIGLAAAQRLIAAGMKVCIGDVDESALAHVQDALGANAIARRHRIGTVDVFCAAHFSGGLTAAASPRYSRRDFGLMICPL